MTGIATTPHSIPGVERRPTTDPHWRTLRLAAIYVAVVSALITGLLAVSVALAPAAPTPDEMRHLQPGPGMAAVVLVGPGI